MSTNFIQNAPVKVAFSLKMQVLSSCRREHRIDDCVNDSERVELQISFTVGVEFTVMRSCRLADCQLSMGHTTALALAPEPVAKRPSKSRSACTACTIEESQGVPNAVRSRIATTQAMESSYKPSKMKGGVLEVSSDE